MCTSDAGMELRPMFMPMHRVVQVIGELSRTAVCGALGALYINTDTVLLEPDCSEIRPDV